MILILMAIILVIICYITYKLTFWSRQGIPNDIASIYNRSQEPFHLSDMKSHQKFGKVVGYSIFEMKRFKAQFLINISS
jgi:hypothetical protein